MQCKVSIESQSSPASLIIGRSRRPISRGLRCDPRASFGQQFLGRSSRFSSAKSMASKFKWATSLCEPAANLRTRQSALPQRGDFEWWLLLLLLLLPSHRRWWPVKSVSKVESLSRRAGEEEKGNDEEKRSSFFGPRTDGQVIGWYQHQHVFPIASFRPSRLFSQLHKMDN